MSFLAFVLIGQLIVAVFIVLVLRVVLNKMLIEMAVRHIEFWKVLIDPKGTKRVYGTVCPPGRRIWSRETSINSIFMIWGILGKSFHYRTPPKLSLNLQNGN